MPEFDEKKDFEKQKLFFEKRGIVFLEDEYEAWAVKVWSMSLTSLPMGGFSVDVDVVFTYAKEYGENKLETLELIKKIERSRGE